MERHSSGRRSSYTQFASRRGFMYVLASVEAQSCPRVEAVVTMRIRMNAKMPIGCIRATMPRAQGKLTAS
jgi:hypothetical protein